MLFPQVEQPRVRKGNLGTIGISAGIIVFALLTLFMQTRDEKIAAVRRSPPPEDDESNHSVRKSVGSVDIAISSTLAKEGPSDGVNLKDLTV